MISDADLLDYMRAASDDPETQRRNTEVLRRLEKAAVAAAQRHTGRYLGPIATITETIRWRGWPLELANEPIGGVVTSVKQWSGSAFDTVTTDNYYAYGSHIYAEGTWNFTSLVRFQVTYEAGYAYTAEPDAWEAPEDVQQAVLLLVGHWFENREAVVADSSSEALPLAVTYLLDNATRATV